MKLHFSALSLAAAIGVLAAGTALATPIELQLTSGTTTTGVLGLNTTCAGTVVCSGSSIEYSNMNFDGWKIVVAGGISSSPSITPYALDVNSLTATCTSGGCASDNLVISLSDTDFTAVVPMNGFGVELSSSSTGSVSQTAYGGNSNTYFDMSNQIGTTLMLPGGPVWTVGGGPAGPSEYSLTLVDTLMHGNGNSYSTDGRIVPTPEPGTLALFGAGLLGCAIFVGRRRRVSQNRA